MLEDPEYSERTRAPGLGDGPASPMPFFRQSSKPAGKLGPSVGPKEGKGSMYLGNFLEVPSWESWAGSEGSLVCRVSLSIACLGKLSPQSYWVSEGTMETLLLSSGTSLGGHPSQI